MPSGEVDIGGGRMRDGVPSLGSYAVAYLAKAQADGVDLYAALPLLATYIGHADIVSAE